jgi:hypothetical protein
MAKMAENAQFYFCHQFWPKIAQFGRNQTRGWMVFVSGGIWQVRKKTGQIYAIWSKTVVEFKLCVLYRF